MITRIDLATSAVRWSKTVSVNTAQNNFHVGALALQDNGATRRVAMYLTANDLSSGDRKDNILFILDAVTGAHLLK